MRFVVDIVAAATAVFSISAFAAGSDPQVSTAQIVGLTKFLEEQPRNEHAPAIRALMLDWEDKTKDVVDYVCPGVLAPVPDKGVPNGPELAAQFIFGSAAFQIANPSQKGALQPSQLAGMRSMLKVYRVFLASDPKARLPRFDELVAKEADGSLPAYLKPVVATECKQ